MTALSAIRSIGDVIEQMQARLSLIDERCLQLSEDREQTTKIENDKSNLLEEKIRQISSQIHEIETQMASLQAELSSPREFRQRFDLASESEILRWKRLNARFANGAIDHQHKWDGERPTNISVGTGSDGYYVHNSQKSYLALFAGRSTNTEANTKSLGWEWDKSTGRYHKVF